MKKSMGAKTILYPTPVLVVGSYDNDGKPNVMTAAWGGICCSVPPCVTISLRKATYTFSNITQTGAFTVNIPSEKQARYADYFGTVSGKNTDKFAISGLTPTRSTLVNAPYIEEFPFALECRVVHQYEIGLHTQFIGEILDIKAEDNMLNEQGMLDIEKVKPFFYAPEANNYYRMGSLLGAAFSIGQGMKNNVLKK
jgi:flavin reductase (DIM6/NTAB) family NADH-FMN oxidoreductase RutF